MNKNNFLDDVNDIVLSKKYSYKSAESLGLDCEYRKAALEFLVNTKTSMSINKVGPTKQPWSGNISNMYRVTMTRGNEDLTFDYFGSVSDYEDNKYMAFDFYSVLACLNTYVEDSFDEFVENAGFTLNSESEYIKAKSTHLECLRQRKMLESMYNDEELEELNDIN